MKLSVLSENVAGGRFGAEHGLSYLIEHNGFTVLFDTGSSDLFRRNAQKLGVDLEAVVDCVVLSHGHWDHGDGLQYVADKPLVAHPGIFKSRFRQNSNTKIGLKLTAQEVEQRFDVQLSFEPKYLTTEMLFLGLIPKTNDFEALETPFVDEHGYPDFVEDDSALVVVEPDGLVVISGCAHSGICNIVAYARKVTGVQVVKAVIGGFHLKHNNKQTQQTVAYLKSTGVKQVLPSHCTELPALTAFYTAFPFHQIKTGSVLTI